MMQEAAGIGRARNAAIEGLLIVRLALHQAAENCVLRQGARTLRRSMRVVKFGDTAFAGSTTDFERAPG